MRGPSLFVVRARLDFGFTNNHLNSSVGYQGCAECYTAALLTPRLPLELFGWGAALPCSQSSKWWRFGAGRWLLLTDLSLNFTEQIAWFPPHPDCFLWTLQLHVPHFSTAPVLAVAAFLLGKGLCGWFRRGGEEEVPINSCGRVQLLSMLL